MQPTIVNNVETLSNLPWIVDQRRRRVRRARRRDVHRARGCSRCPATSNQPGVFEVEYGVTTFRDLIYAPEYGGGIRDGHELKAFIPGGASAPWFFEEHLDLPLEKADGRQGRLDARLGRHRRDGRDHRRGEGLPGASCGSSPASPAASARRAARARPGSSRSCGASSTATAGPSDLDLLLDVCDNISPGLDLAAQADHDLPARPVGGRRRSPRRSSASATSSRPTSAGRGTVPVLESAASTSTRRLDRCLTAPTATRPRRRPSPSPSTAARSSRPNRASCVIDAAERTGVYIPRFCYHPRMQPVGMCRMCIVEIDTGRGPGAAAELHDRRAPPGMKVDTDVRRSPRRRRTASSSSSSSTTRSTARCATRAASARCRTRPWPTGPGESRFVEEKRHFEKPIPISDLVLLDRERCILCDRCTRFAKEVAGDPLIHFIDRGNETEVNTFPDEPFASYFSGNTVQICPVGRAHGQALPLQGPAVGPRAGRVAPAPTCSVGCRVVDRVVAATQVLRYQGVDIDPVNWGWLCDKGRFDFEAGRPATTASASRWCAPAATTWSPTPLGRRARRRPPTRSRPRATPAGRRAIGRARRRPAHQRGRLRLGQAGQGRPRHRQRRRPARRRPAGRGRAAACPAATIDEACAAGGTVVLLGPDLKEELPVLYLRLRHAASSDGVTRRRAVAPRDTGLDAATRGVAALPPGRGRRRWCAPSSASRPAPTCRRRPTPS